MLRSLYSGISGMKVNQAKLDVVGNNIANVGTTSFKYSRVRFQDMMSQTASSAMSPSLNQGGINPKQIGLGVQLAGIDTIMGTGMMQPTSRPLDAAIDGEGFFIVGKGPKIFDASVKLNPATHDATATGMEMMFSRDGAFALDSEGNLLSSDGYRIMGYSLTEGEPTLATPAVAEVIGKTNNIVIDFTKNVKIDNIDLGKVADAGALDAAISENPVLSEKYTSATNGTNLVLTQKVGSATNPVVDNEGAVTVTMATPGVKAAQVQAASSKTSIETNGDIAFVDGKKGLLANSGSLKTLRIPDVVKQPIVDNTGNTIGYTDDRILSFSIEKDGVIKAVLASGKVAALGQIAMAGFKNPGGLQKLGKNLYSVSANSGAASIRSGAGDITNDNSKAFGEMMGNTLEMSNVDLAEQFTEMIVSSRAFQAAGKTITTGDEILQDIINLKR